MSWRGDTRGIIRRYPEHKAKLEALRQQSMTANYNGMPGGGDVSRTTEDIAIRQLPKREQREYDAVEFAIRCTVSNYPRDYQDRLKLLTALYWDSTRRTIAGAAMLVPCSERTAKTWNAEFVQRVDAVMMVLGARF